MNRFKTQKSNSFLRTSVTLIAFTCCVLVAFSHSKKPNENPFPEKISFRIMTYNIHHGEGMDGVVDLERIASVIKKENPDILLLQEVDVNVERSGYKDIPSVLSELTGLQYTVFGKNIDLSDGTYGNATLSKFPINRSKNYKFEKMGPEQRGVLVTKIPVNGQQVLVINSHFDHRSEDSERIMYAQKIREEILPKYNTDKVLIGGDFNDIPSSRTIGILSEEFKDVWSLNGIGKGYTIPADQPAKRIYYIFLKGDIKSDSTWVVNTKVSDHRPVVSNITLMNKNQN